ncbi:MAG: HAD-IB family hydrolase, partial [Phycisphaerales bacterium]|nr:HAD-IB family hydrolase [Phycisphaerales bacterium]
MSLAIFDLDNTLLAGDSDYLWGRFLIEQGLVDQESFERENQRFYDQYRAGTLDIQKFL